MSTIVTRAGKGSPLTNNEVDSNFTNLNTDKIQVTGTPTTGQAIVWNGTAWVPGSSGVGDVVGPASSTDNALTRFDGTTGKLVQNSTATLSDTGALATANVTADYYAWNTGAGVTPAVGQRAWDANQGTTALGLLGGHVVTRDGQSLVAYVTNAEAVTITKGQAVYLFSAVGDRASVKLAYNTADAASAKTLGIVAEDIAAGASGFVMCQGVAYKMNTAAYNAGDVLYLGATAGSITTTKPYAPNHLVYLGVVEKANAGNGQIYVRVQNGYELDELHNVSAQSPTTGQTIVWNSATNLWEKNTVSLTAGVNGVLPTANGGTNLTSFTSGGVVYASSTSALATGSALTFDGTATFRLTNGTAGYFRGPTDMLIGEDASSLYIGEGFGANPAIPFKYGSSGTTFQAWKAGGSEQMRLTSTGLGIGTSSPATKLDVVGSAQIGASTAKTKFYSDSTYNGIFNGASLGSNESIYMGGGMQFFYASGSEQMRLTSTGLGIGTSSPAQKLDVSGSGTISARVSSTSGNATFILNSASTFYNYLQYSSAGSGGLILYDTTNSANRVVLDSAGNLGLGVTPSAWRSLDTAFQVGPVASLNSDTDVTTDVGYNYFYNSSNIPIYSTTAQASRYSQYLGAHRWYTAASGTAGNAISFTQAMTLDASGNLGIGTSSPAYKLDLLTSANFAGRWANATRGGYLYLDSGGPGIFNTAAYGGEGMYFHAGSNYIKFITNSVERMTLDASGNLLLGTTASNYRLNVRGAGSVGDSSVYAQFTTADTGTTGNDGLIIGVGVGSSPIAYINNLENSALAFATNGTERARISAAGGFSVGTTADPGAGAIYATGNITAYYSDDRLKTRLGNIENALDKVDQLQGFYYEANETAQALGYKPKREVGVSAQSVQAVLPEIVSPAPIDQQYLTLDYERLVPLLIEAVKELRAEVKALKGE